MIKIGDEKKLRIRNKPDRAKALSTSEQRYRTLVETMGDGLSEIDENQVTTYVNEWFIF